MGEHRLDALYARTRRSPRLARLRNRAWDVVAPAAYLVSLLGGLAALLAASSWMPDWPGLAGATRFSPFTDQGSTTLAPASLRVNITSTRNASATSVALTIPTTAVVGDMLIVFTLRQGTTGTLSISDTVAGTPTAMAAEASTGTTAADVKCAAYYYKLQTGDVDGTKTVTMNVTVGGQIAICGEVWSNPHPSTVPTSTGTTGAAATSLTLNPTTLNNAYPGISTAVVIAQTATGTPNTVSQAISGYTTQEAFSQINGNAANSLSFGHDTGNLVTLTNLGGSLSSHLWSWTQSGKAAGQTVIVPGPGLSLLPVIVPGYYAGKGSWTQLVASTPFASSAMIVHLLLADWAATTPIGPYNIFVDIGVGGAGSEIVKIPDLLVCYWSFNATAATETAMPQATFVLPIAVPVGTRLAARAVVNLLQGESTNPQTLAVKSILVHGQLMT